jgi:predicted aspartyl protease
MRSGVYQTEQWKDLLWVRAAIGGVDQQVLVARLLVDTGSSFTILSTNLVRLAGCNLANPLRFESVATGSGVLRCPIVEVPGLNCLGRQIKNFPVMVHTIPLNAYIDGLLGIDFLRNFQAVIDVAEAQIHLKEDVG